MRSSVKRIGVDLLLVLTAVFVSRLLSRDELTWDGRLSFELGVLSLTYISLAVWRRLDRIHRSYLGLRDAFNIGAVCFFLFLTDLIVKTILRFPSPKVALAESVLFGFIAVTVLMGSYIVQRQVAIKRRMRHKPADGRATRVLIVGAGDAGEIVAREMLKGERMVPLAFVDDDPRKLGITIHGLPVMGLVDQIPSLIKQLHADEVLIATPSANSNEMRRIYKISSESGVTVRTLPPLQDIISGDASLVGRIREIQLEDLLNRDPVKIDLIEVASYLRGQRVLITGAGGSIGSELARQVAELKPSELILLGRGENSIYSIQQELIRKGFDVPTCIIADVRDRKRVEAVFAQHRPSIVFHAAAHKHVPLMQANPIEAALNNVFGTLNVAECAARFGAERCIYISTDKAADPTSIMGATKRIGELIIQNLAKRSSMKFSVVRFGNVLGSRGSVVPLMEQQIREGGPVTVTDPEMTRFFMTIPEAVTLILQAGALAGPGDVYVLDMGTPVKIADMARDLILMHGLVPDRDINIVYTGVRPGEKIHEVLAGDAEKLEPTGRPKINRVKPDEMRVEDTLHEQLKMLGRFCEEMDDDATKVTIMDMAWQRIPKNPLSETEERP